MLLRKAALFFAVLTATLCCSVRSQRSNTASQPAGTQIVVGANPQCLALADFNDDSKVDIAVGNADSANVTILLGDGKGNFSQATGSPFSAGQSPNDLAVGDINADGHRDLAIANHDATYVTILLGNGRGQFTPAPSSPIPVKSRPHPHGIALADFNGDGKLDFVIDDWGNNQVTVVFGKGAGDFASPGVSFAVGQMPYQRVRAADVNKDGLPDVITTNMESADVSVLLANGKGGFTPAPGSPARANPDPFGLTVGDVNGDGNVDLAIINYSGQPTDAGKDAITILIGSGNGRFAPASGSPFKSGRSPGSIAVGDVNGDGIDDVASANMGSNNITLLLGGKNGLRVAGNSPIVVGKDPEFVALGDLNGDRKADLVVAESETNVIRIILSQ